MNENKICFVWNISDKRKFEESLKYVQALSIPEGFTIEIIEIENSANPTKEFNNIQHTFDAKYKIFIDESTLIIDKHFLFKILNIFRSNKRIGMIGAIGAKQIDKGSNWVASNSKVGSVYTHRNGKLELVSYSSSPTYKFEQSAVLDEAFLATQYDIPFDEANQKYDIAQSIKFIKEGYHIGVLTNDKPLIIMDRPLLIESHNHSLMDINFVNSLVNLEVSNHLPLVSILIPTYNRPYFFELALNSALNQTYPNIEIIVADDSTDNLTERLMKEKYLPYFNQIRYFKNEINLGQFNNDIKLFELANGEFINFLMDDDLFRPDKIEKMMKYYLDDSNEEITLVTSHRSFINDSGDLYKDEGVTQKPFDKDTMLPGIEFGNMLLKYNFNFIGEPTTVLFRKKDLTVPFGTFAGREYGCNVDCATWLTLLSKGKGVYINETLSYFRLHSSQQLQSDKMKVLGLVDYAYQVLYSKSSGYLGNEEDYHVALSNVMNYAMTVVSKLQSVDYEKEELVRILGIVDSEILNINENRGKLVNSKMRELYPVKSENLIVFLVPGMDFITGGILSIYSIYEETKKLSSIHKSNTIMATLPNAHWHHKNTKFQNDVFIFPFEALFKYFTVLKKCIIHIPEVYVGDFLNNISNSNELLLKSISSLQINILNQNDKYMPEPHFLKKLKRLTNNITCTTAHERYTTKEKRMEYGVPLHLFSTNVNAKNYNYTSYSEKEHLLVVSPDPHPEKEKILSLIKRSMPDLRIEIVHNISFEEYKKLVAKAKWTLTFGEGLDGYFVETILSGGIGLAVYNSTFFTKEFRGLNGIFGSYDTLYQNIVNYLIETDKESFYDCVQREQSALVNKIYNYEKYINNIKNYYLGNYDYN